MSCHDTPGIAEERIDRAHSHPVDVDQKRHGDPVAIGTGQKVQPLPLYDDQGRHTNGNGRVACGSCHDPHTWTADKDTRKKEEAGAIVSVNAGMDRNVLCDREGAAGKKQRLEGDGRNSFLRLAAAPASQLCVECHQDQRRVFETNHDLTISAPEAKNYRGQTLAKSGICGQCHIPHKARGPVRWAREMGPGEAAIEGLCRDCHRSGNLARDKLTGTFSHPVGIKPGENMKTQDLPTFTSQGEKKKDGSGMMDCATCHDTHGGKPTDQVTANKTGKKGKPSYQFLRKAIGAESELCKSCHRHQGEITGTKHDLRLTAAEEKNIRDQTLAQSGICGACHVVHNATGPFIWGRKPVAGMDPATATCLSCHDDRGLAKDKGIGERSHPVDVDMKSTGISLAAGKWSGDGNREKLIALPMYDKQGQHSQSSDGRVSCGTCHDPHRWSADGKTAQVSDIKKLEGGPDDSFLRIADRGNSALCINCHLDQKPVARSKHNLALFLSGKKSSPKDLDTRAVHKQGDQVISYAADQAPTGDQLTESGDNQAEDRQQLTGTGTGGSAGGVCATCHMPHKAKGPLLWARSTGPGKGPIEVLCKDCHQKTSNASDKLTGPHDHPVGVKFTATMQPHGLPTYSEDGKKRRDGKGFMDCTTCHDPHRWQPQPATDPDASQLVEGDGQNSFLRMLAAPSSRLCLECHQDQRMVIATDHDLNITAPKATNRLGETSAESGVCGQCHIPHNGLSEYQWARLWEDQGKNSAEERCLGCHSEGEVASNKIPPVAKHPDEVRVWSTLDVSSPLRGHPLPELPVYNQAGQQDKTGVIGCASCHNPHQWSPDQKADGPGKNVEGNLQTSFLRNVNSESFLCADCHGEDALFRYLYFHKESAHQKNHLYLGVPTGPPVPPKRP
ncbi:MAG: hypothetical protein A2W28_00065 [Gammaproteobacteria bacterium RBG_16_51_14]|nr:MAG: hypothetical protein A2W28_00065 [Gammaproteobacteria bacterium RBG_16_51_14]